MKSKIIFVSDPDFVLGASIGIKNFKDKHVREFLNLCEKTLAIYLVDQTSSKEWLDKIQKQNFLRLAKSMFDKYGQEGVVIEYVNTYKYFKSLEEVKQWGRDNKIFKLLIILCQIHFY